MASRWLCPFSCQAGWSLGAGAGFLPAQPGRGHLPAPVLHVSLARVCVQPTCRGGLRAKGNLIVFPTDMFYSVQPTAFHSCCLLTGPLVAVLQAHTRPGTLPVTLPSLPTQGLRRAEMMGPTQNWPLLIFFRRALECPPWEFSQPSPLVHTDRGQAHRASISSGPSSPFGRPRPRTWAA